MVCSPKEVYQKLVKTYPKADVELKFRTPFQLLVATILSAQCTDKRVNLVTKGLFKKYKAPKDFVSISKRELEKIIKSTGFFRAKAKNIKGAAKMIVEEFKGRVPKKMEELIKLPGVARKTANIVLTEGYGIVEGIAVDTHVKRVTYRLGWTKNTDPKKIELDLMKMFSKRSWGKLSITLIFHGRRTCFARKPNCDECTVAKCCPSRRK